MTRRVLIAFLIIAGLTIGPSVHLFAQPQTLPPVQLRPGQTQPNECPTTLSGTLALVHCEIDNQPTLVASYKLNNHYINQLRYRPRIVTDGPYAGWDMLQTTATSINQDQRGTDWLRVTLNRPATVAVVWKGGDPVPPWLSAWTPAEPSGTFPVYQRTVEAGELILPGNNYQVTNPAARNNYHLLLAEAGGTPSPAPVPPAGQIAPQSNQACPDWLHASWTTTGPDGEIYATGHPQIDPVFWCYYQHEHGITPANLSETHQPSFGYAAVAHGMSEPHAGFKSYGFPGDNGTRWLITHHFGTSGIGRVCARFHSIDVYVEAADGTVLRDVHYLGDFGKAVAAGVEHPAYTPSACPDQGQIEPGNNGLRVVPSNTEQNPYEPWLLNNAQPNILGLIMQGVSFTTHDPSVLCADLTCDTGVIKPGRSGSTRSLLGTVALQAGAQTGEFWTDPFGAELREANDHDAVRQYVAPGATSTAEEVYGKCRDLVDWGQLWSCGVGNAGDDPSERENSIPDGGPN